MAGPLQFPHKLALITARLVRVAGYVHPQFIVYDIHKNMLIEAETAPIPTREKYRRFGHLFNRSPILPIWRSPRANQ